MAYNNILNQAETYIAGADLSAEQYTFVKISAGGTVVQANAGEAAIGVLWNDPASGRAATVIKGGNPNVYSGAAIVAGALVTSDNEGRAVTATSTDVALGRARYAVAGADQLVMIDFFGEAQYTVA